MANTSREQLKAWFRRGMKPLQSQFAAWIDSFWHKDDSIPMASIEGLADALNNIAVPVDDTISDESENPVQNKVIKTALDGKADTVHYHDEYAGYGDIADLQAQIDLLAQREPSAREVVTVATADELDEIEEPSTEVIYKTLDESKLYLYDGERFNDVTGQAVDNSIYVADISVLLSLTLDDGVYSVLVVEGSAVSATYSLSVASGGRVLANQDGWALAVESGGSSTWQWHRYSYQGHTHTIAEITDLPDIADSIVLALNPNTYEITATIKKGNTTIATSAAIDLPLETMVVGGSYNKQTKKVVLTLKNGQTVEFSVADLVSGLAATSDLASVAFSGNYNDLINKPTIPAAQIQPDWNQTDNTSKDFIKNKPQLGTSAALNVAASGNAANNEVVKGDDTRLPKGDSNTFNGTMESGKTYRLASAISNLTVTTIEDGYFESNLIFTVSGNSFTITLPQGTLIAGTKPDFSNGVTYIMSAYRGIVVFSVLTTFV